MPITKAEMLAIKATIKLDSKPAIKSGCWKILLYQERVKPVIGNEIELCVLKDVITTKISGNMIKAKIIIEITVKVLFFRSSINWPPI